MQAIIYNLLSNGNQDFNHISEYSPFFEIDKTWCLTEESATEGRVNARTEEKHQQLQWRVFNTHLRWDMMPKCPNMRYIYVVRSGKDVALSFFQHLSNQDDADCFNGTLLDFLAQWCEGSLPFGNWVHHLQSWMDAYHRQKSGGTGIVENDDSASASANEAATPTSPILLVRYEDMVQQPLECVQRIIAHLDLGDRISPQRAEELLQYVSFEYMKSHQQQYMPVSVPWKAGYHFIRNGKVGDSENYFAEPHNQVYDAMLRRIFSEQFGAETAPAWLTELNVL